MKTYSMVLQLMSSQGKLFQTVNIMMLGQGFRWLDTEMLEDVLEASQNEIKAKSSQSNIN